MMDFSNFTEEQWQSHFDNVEIFDGRGKLNAYVCERCGYATITVDRAKGVTPFMLRCRRDDGFPSQCKGQAQSRMYHAQLQGRFIPFYEWYRPTLVEILTHDEQMKEHFWNGGLMLRRIVSEQPSGIKRFVAENYDHLRFQGEKEKQRRINQMQKKFRKA